MRLGYSDEIRLLDGLDDLGELRHVAFGLIAEAGLKVDIDQMQLGFSGSYYHDFTKLAQWDFAAYGGFKDAIKLKMMTLNFSLGYRL